MNTGFADAWKRGMSAFFNRIASVSRPLLIIVLVGIIVRLIVGFFATYTFDIYHWGVIVSNINSGHGLYELDGYYYTPPWGYILGTISTVGEFFGFDNIGERVTDALMTEQYGWHFTATLTTMPFIILMKIPLLLCDLAVAYVIRWIVIERCNDIKKGNIAFALWFLCPLTIVAGGVSVMFDTFTVLMLLLCIVFMMQDRGFLAGTMFSLAVLMKFFPAFLVFVLIAYILKKHKDNGLATRKLVETMTGAAVMFLIVMLPQIINGELSEAFSFLTSRASSGMGAGLGVIERYGSVLAYVIFAVVSVLLAFRMYKCDSGHDLNDTLMFVLLLNVTILFLYPSTPQYMLLILPFLIYHAVVRDWNITLAGSVLVIGAVIFALASNFTLLLSLSEFTGIVDMASLMSTIDLFQSDVLGLSPMAWIFYVGGALQYVGTLLVLLHVCKPFLKKKNTETESRDTQHAN